ncbi:MAG: helix-turn-helix domain-containing protein [Lachnospiraceae bacterium]|nr:helix-turn-helix domain-containing protein [Lachnospiraceae bacterium]
MGRKSIRENKNIYFVSRENTGMTREAASNELGYISADRIEKIENEKSAPHPDEVLAMAKAYKNPSLCNYYCSHECPIGKEYVPEVESKALEKITLEMLATLNTLSAEKDRLIEITVDGTISEDEIHDFKRIKEHLSQMSLAINSLNLWVDNAIATGAVSTASIKRPD